MMYQNIPTYIINLRERVERKEYIISEFEGRYEFETFLIEACEHGIGAVGLWNTIKRILESLIKDKDDFIILCEDDHQFTSEYSSERLIQYIEEAKLLDTDVLSGGISGFTSAVQVSDHLYWVEKFSGLQFTIIFRKFFEKILNADFGQGDAADYKMCELTDNKFFIHPFISTQKDFGYSDATPKNNREGRIDELFNQSEVKIQMLKRVSQFYQESTSINDQKVDIMSTEDITIPTYVINLPERTERRKHIIGQFKNKKEFTIHIIEACKHKIGAVGLWLSIRKIISIAVANNDDVIIICEDDHAFTSNYRKEILIKNILQAHAMRCNLVIGGVGGFNVSLPVTDNLWWVDSFWCTQFIVVYKKFFGDILREPFNDTDTADGKFSEMTSQKMVLYPFISVQKDFGYSDVTIKNHITQGLITRYFKSSDERLLQLQKIGKRFNK